MTPSRRRRYLKFATLPCLWAPTPTIELVCCSIDFDVRTGETVGLLGESGAGKTTLSLGNLTVVAGVKPRRRIHRIQRRSVIDSEGKRAYKKYEAHKSLSSTRIPPS